MELLPAKATFAPGEHIVVEARGGSGTVRLLHLDRVVAEADVQDGTVAFPPQPEGGYGIDADGGSTALDVLADPLTRPRYGVGFQTGDQDWEDAPPVGPGDVIARTSDPSAFIRKISSGLSGAASLVFRSNTSCLLSGDHAGAVLMPPVVSARWSEPSSLMTNICGWLLSSKLTKAM